MRWGAILGPCASSTPKDRSYRERSWHWVSGFDYREAGPQLLLQAFLRRVVDRGGGIEHERDLGQRRTDLSIVWAGREDWPSPDGAAWLVVECKVLHPRHGLDATIAQGLAQTAGYMDRCGPLDGRLVICDRQGARTWDETGFRGRTITVWHIVASQTAPTWAPPSDHGLAVAHDGRATSKAPSA